MGRLGFNGKMSFNQTHPLAHADQAKSDFRPRMPGVETNTRVRDAKIDAIAMTGQFHCGLRASTVFHDVAQGLLRDAKQTERHILGNLTGNVAMDELDLQVVLRTEFAAETTQ